MKTRHLAVASLLSVLFITVSAVTPTYAVNNSPPPTKEAPTGADCRKAGQDAANKVKKAGGTEKQQQAAYERAKHNCMSKM